MLLSLPYTYRTELLPARCRNTRELVVRDNVLADVREVYRHEVEPAIELAAMGTSPAELIVLSPEGRLMAPARDVLSRDPLTPKEFERANAGKNDGDRVFSRELFPYEGIRHGAPGGLPWDARTMTEHMMAQGWVSAKLVGGDQNDRFLEAAAYLSEAVMVIDGVVHVECREPAWRFNPWPHPGRAVLEPAPDRVQSRHLFRLDRWDDACEWARLQGGVAPRVRPSARILAASALTRDDPLEIGTTYRNQMRSAWIWHLGHRAMQAVDDETYAAVDDGLARDAGFSRDEALELMNDYLRVFRLLVNEQAPYRATGSASWVPTVMDRWDLERRRGLARTEAAREIELSQEDIDALIGL